MKFMKCKLTDKEIKEYGQLQASLLVEVEELEKQKKELAKEITPKKKRIKELAPIIDSGSEMRDVECEWVYHWDDGVKQARRLDNKQWSGARVPIEEHERQETLV
jgi:hypothetical protein